MTHDEFEQLVGDEFPNAIPGKFQEQIKNVAFLVEDEPSAEVRSREGLSEDETLLGLYQGVPATARGDGYGVGMVLPDTITLYQHPIEVEAHILEAQYRGAHFLEIVRKVIRDTIWHEVAHHFGYNETQVREREGRRDSM